MKRLFACLGLCLAFLVAIPAMADIIVGNLPDPGTGNAFPWGFTYNAEYQRVYQSSDFNGPEQSQSPISSSSTPSSTPTLPRYRAATGSSSCPLPQWAWVR
jgi:hypothetical protein